MERGAFWSFESFKRDFEAVFDHMCAKMWRKQEKYGKSFQDNTDISYYLKRPKEEIEEFEAVRETDEAFDEALDIGNFAMMIIYHLGHRRAES